MLYELVHSDNSLIILIVTNKGGGKIMDIPNIEFYNDPSYTIRDLAEDEVIQYYKDREYFEDRVTRNKFIKACEKMIRTSKDYSAFISWIKSVLGINFCQVSSSIFDKDSVLPGATIEMHHGPLFTLYDYVNIILNYFIDTGKKISTPRIANAVLDEHFELRVQVVMLTVTNHEAVHNQDIFININQGIGNLGKFIDIYGNYMDDEQKAKVWNYYQLCKENNSFDSGILDIENVIGMIE